MKKPRGLLHLAALAMGLCLLAGCAAQPAAPAQATIPHIETSPQPTVAPSPTPTQTPAQQQDLQQVYGSCGLLAWPSVLYSIYLQDDANPWTEEALAQTRQNLAVAVDWITQQAQTYNAQPKIYYDTLLAEEEINAKGMLELYLKAAGQRAEFFVRDEEGKVLKLIKDVSLLPYSTEEAGGFVGCTLGVYASSNGEMSDRFADVAWISYEGIPD